MLLVLNKEIEENWLKSSEKMALKKIFFSFVPFFFASVKILVALVKSSAAKSALSVEIEVDLAFVAVLIAESKVFHTL